MKRWIRRLLAAAILVGGLTATAGPAHADSLCGRVTVWAPVGSHTACVPLL
jgi:hypothetical protein